MIMNSENFGYDWSKYERSWFSSRLSWIANPSADMPQNHKREQQDNLHDGDHLSMGAPDVSQIDDMGFEQIFHNANCAMRTIKAMAHSDRLTALMLIAIKPRTVSELTAMLKLRQPAVSQILAKLRASKLVATTRTGKHISYHIIDATTCGFLSRVSEVFSIFPPEHACKCNQAKEHDS